MTSMNRRAFARAMLAAGLTVAGVSAHAESTPATLRIGYQKSSTLITLLKTRGTLEQALAPLGLRVSWHEFASGLPLTEALNVGAVDFSADVADTVPVFAQAAHARFVYVAQEAPSPKAQAIVVKQDSTLRTLADLKGKRIAITKAAGSHYLLLAALARAKLAPADAAIHYLTPADGRAAFERGSVDAWITWDPMSHRSTGIPTCGFLPTARGSRRTSATTSPRAVSRLHGPTSSRSCSTSCRRPARGCATTRRTPRTHSRRSGGSTRQRSRVPMRGAAISCAPWSRKTSANNKRSPIPSSRRDCCPLASIRDRRCAGISRQSARSRSVREDLPRQAANIFVTSDEILLTDSGHTLE